MYGFYPNIVETCAQFAVVIILVAVAMVLLWLAAIIDIVRNDFKRDADKIVWFLFVMILPPIGVLLYLFIGRFQKINRKPVSRSTRYRDIGRD
jgi:Phospholipase_D-nuclease N-terminal